MRNPRWWRKGNFGWALVVAVVLAWDMTAEEEELLTRAFRRAYGTPHGKVAILTVWALLTAHLFGVLPQKADPFHMITILRQYGIVNKELEDLLQSA